MEGFIFLAVFIAVVAFFVVIIRNELRSSPNPDAELGLEPTPSALKDYPIIFKGPDQSRIASEATYVVSSIEKSMPTVPRLSNSGQQDAFYKIVKLVDDEIDGIEADPEAKLAISFWALTILYANSLSFRLAAAAIKNFGHAQTPVSRTFVSWIGSDSHPGEVVLENMNNWSL